MISHLHIIPELQTMRYLYPILTLLPTEITQTYLLLFLLPPVWMNTFMWAFKSLLVSYGIDNE